MTKETYTIMFTKEERDFHEEMAVEHGFKSVSEYLAKTAVNIAAQKSIGSILEEQQAAYLEQFREHLTPFIEKEEDGLILRRAHFYFTSKQSEIVLNETLKNKARDALANQKHADAVREYLNDDAVLQLEAGIKNATTTRGDLAKHYHEKMEQELDKLDQTNYKKEKIKEIFRLSF